jgi:hypothetical protein
MQGVSAEDAVQSSMEAKAREFSESGGAIYAKP